MAAIRDWLAQPRVVAMEPGPRHAEILEHVLAKYRVSGRHVTDAMLAAMAIEVGGTIASADTGFARFAELRWINPLDPR
jgi:predicted nucleic acid-binding protein